MDSSVALILYMLIFIGFLLAFEGIVQLLFGYRANNDEAINKRLRMLSTGADPEEVLRILRRRRERTWLDRVPILRGWPPLIIQAGLKTPPNRIFSMMAAGFVVLGVLLWAFAFGLMAAMLIALVLAFVLPYLILSVLRNQRIDHLRRQMPDAIDLMVRSLRAGFPLPASFQVIAREMTDPIGSEFGLISDAIAYGDDLTDAVIEFVERVKIEEAAYLGVAINIQAGTGGNLSNVLEALSTVIRERFAMMRKIKAVSSEARLTAWVVSAAPLIIFGALQLVSPSYYGEVSGHWMYNWILASGAALAAINALILHRLVRFHF